MEYVASHLCRTFLKESAVLDASMWRVRVYCGVWACRCAESHDSTTESCGRKEEEREQTDRHTSSVSITLSSHMICPLVGVWGIPLLSRLCLSHRHVFWDLNINEPDWIKSNPSAQTSADNRIMLRWLRPPSRTLQYVLFKRIESRAAWFGVGEGGPFCSCSHFLCRWWCKGDRPGSCTAES